MWQRYQDVALQDPETVSVPSRQAMDSAGLLIELGLLPGATEAESQKYLSSAEELIDRILTSPASQFPHYSSARLGNIFLPAYKGYREGRMATADIRTQQRMDISSLMFEVREAPVHKDMSPDHIYDSDHQPCFASDDFLKGVYAKLACLSLILGEGLNILPTTSRSRAVHDAFVFCETNVVPTKIKVGNHVRGADRGSTFKKVSLEKLAHDANRLPNGQLIMNIPDSDLVEKVMRQIERDGTRIRGDTLTNIENVVDRMGYRLKDQLQKWKPTSLV